MPKFVYHKDNLNKEYFQLNIPYYIDFNTIFRCLLYFQRKYGYIPNTKPLIRNTIEKVLKERGLSVLFDPEDELISPIVRKIINDVFPNLKE